MTVDTLVVLPQSPSIYSVMDSNYAAYPRIW